MPHRVSTSRALRTGKLTGVNSPPSRLRPILMASAALRRRVLSLVLKYSIVLSFPRVPLRTR